MTETATKQIQKHVYGFLAIDNVYINSNEVIAIWEAGKSVVIALSNTGLATVDSEKFGIDCEGVFDLICNQASEKTRYKWFHLDPCGLCQDLYVRSDAIRIIRREEPNIYIKDSFAYTVVKMDEGLSFMVSDKPEDILW